MPFLKMDICAEPRNAHLRCHAICGAMTTPGDYPTSHIAFYVGVLTVIARDLLMSSESQEFASQ